jgi:hypothetical protein
VIEGDLFVSVNASRHHIVVVKEEVLGHAAGIGSLLRPDHERLNPLLPLRESP